MSGYSILILICSTALSHADCQAKTAVDVVGGPTVDNAIMCALNAQSLAFTERVKMYSLLMEGLDLVFKDRGLKPLSELTRIP